MCYKLDADNWPKGANITCADKINGALRYSYFIAQVCVASI